jgi:hypothetical protein
VVTVYVGRKINACTDGVLIVELTFAIVAIEVIWNEVIFVNVLLIAAQMRTTYDMGGGVLERLVCFF